MNKENILIKELNKYNDDVLNVVISDNFALKGEEMTCGSKMLKHFNPPYTATAIDLINENNINLIGKTNITEFNQFPIIEKDNLSKFYFNSLAINENLGDLSLSLDTGGESRISSSYYGLIGFKPSYGSISRYGIAPVSNTFDQIATIGKSIKEIKTLNKVLFSKDNRDLTSIKNESLNEKIEDKPKFGVIKSIESYIKSDTVLSSYNQAINKLKDKYEVVEIELPNLEEILRAFVILSSVEFSTNMAMYDSLVYGLRTKDYEDISQMYEESRRAGFTLDTIGKIILGTYLVTEDNNEKIYKVAIKNRQIFNKNITSIFRNIDLLLTPTTPYNYEDFNSLNDLNDVNYNYLFTSIANLVGLPAISVSNGINGENVGIQLIGDKLKDNLVLKGGEILGEIENEN